MGQMPVIQSSGHPHGCENNQHSAYPYARKCLTCLSFWHQGSSSQSPPYLLAHPPWDTLHGAVICGVSGGVHSGPLRGPPWSGPICGLLRAA